MVERPLLLVVFYTGAVFLLGGLLAVPTQSLLALLLERPPPLHEWCADLLKIVALAGIWPLLKLARIPLRSGLGISWPPTARLEAWAGLMFGLITLTVLILVLFWLDVRAWRPGIDAEFILKVVLKASITALLVATIEELWFRGALQSTLMRSGPLVGLMGVALIYTSLHFVRADAVVAEPHRWFDGLTAIQGMFGRFQNPTFADSAAALFVAGLMFGWLRLYTGCIAACWGLHVGWVFGIQFSRRVSVSTPSEFDWLTGRYDGVIGIGFIAVVFLTAVLVGWLWRPDMHTIRQRMTGRPMKDD